MFLLLLSNNKIVTVSGDLIHDIFASVFHATPLLIFQKLLLLKGHEQNMIKYEEILRQIFLSMTSQSYFLTEPTRCPYHRCK